MKPGLKIRLNQLIHLQKCKKWAYFLAELKSEKANEKAIKMVWDKFKKL